MLQETWLNLKQSVEIKNFVCVRSDRTSDSRHPHGGVAIFIQKDIPFKRVKFCNTQNVEGVFISVDSGAFPIIFGSVYSSSSLSRKEAKSDLMNILSQPGPFVLAGDWNAKSQTWNNVQQNFKGIDVKGICENKNIEIHFPDHPTLCPDNKKGQLSVVDFVLSKNVFEISKPEVIFDLSSDHRPITFTVRASLAFPLAKKVKNFLKADWKKFRNLIEVDINSDRYKNSNSNQEIDLKIENYKKVILDAADKAIPSVKPSQFRYPFSQAIDDLRKERNNIRRAFKKQHLFYQRNQVNCLNKRIRELTDEMKSESWKKKLSSLSTEDLSFYDFAKNLKRKKITSPLKNSDGELVYSDMEKANLIAEAFHSSHVITNATTNKSADVEANKNMILNLHVDFPDNCKITAKELQDLIKIIKIKKAAGYDEITNRLVKNLPESLIERIAFLFNDCLRLGYFPRDWKVAKVIALDKPGKDPTIPSNKRPISLLPVLGKLFEKTILTRMSDFENDNKIIINQQFGFRHQHSTTQQLMRIIEFTSLRFNENKSTGMVLLDIEKAFDSVWHDALLFKLSKYKFPAYLLKIIESFLSSRIAFVEINGNKSKPYELPAGTPQGSILSPRLFTYFINDLPVPRGCKTATFADDTGITASGKNYELEKIVDTLTEGCKEVTDYFTDWKVKVNASKTEAILFTKSPKMLRLRQDYKIGFCNTELEWKNEVKYLGMILDSKLLMRKNIDYNITKAKKAMSTLYCLLKRFSPVQKQEKITIVRSYIRPILTYACPAFSHCAKTHLKRLQIVQNKCLRMALNAPYRTHISELHREAKMPMIDEFLKKLSNSFYEKAELSENPLIKRLGAIDRSSSFRKIKHRIPCKNSF